MAQVNVVSTLNGLFKEVYPESITNLIPVQNKFVTRIKFNKRKRIGKQYHQPLVLAGEQGTTYASAGAGAFDLNASVALSMDDALVDGSQFVLSGEIDYEAASKAVEGGKTAFVSATRHVMEEMRNSAFKRLEISMVYGQSATGLAQIEDQVAGGTASTAIVTIQPDQWASGIWSGSEGAVIDIFEEDGTTAVAVSGDFLVSSVDSTARTITIGLTAQGVDQDITDLKTQLASGSAGDAVAIFFFRGSSTTDMVGIDKILLNTGSLFSVDAAAFGLWQANTSDAGAAQLSTSKILQAVAKGVDRGLDGPVDVFLNPKTFVDLADDQIQLRSYDSSFKPGEAVTGAETITIHGQNGPISLVPSAVVKEGEAFALPATNDIWVRLGSQEISFDRPGAKGQFFRDLESKAGYQMRVYGNQAVFSKKPAWSTKIFNIVNSS